MSMLKEKLNAVRVLKLEDELSGCDEEDLGKRRTIVRRLATLLNERGRYKRVVDIVTDHLSKDNDGANELSRFLGTAHYEMWVRDEDGGHDGLPNASHINNSFAAYEKTLKVMTNWSNPDILLEVAEVYRAFGAYQGSIKMFGHIIEHFPMYGRLRRVVLSAAVVLCHVSCFKESLRYLEQVLRSPPAGVSDNDVLLLLARTAERHGNREFALKAYRQIHEEMTRHTTSTPSKRAHEKTFETWISHPDTWWGFATRFYDVLREYTASLDFLRRSFELAAASTTMDLDRWAGFERWYMMARVLKRTGLDKDASEALEKAAKHSRGKSVQAVTQAFRASSEASMASRDAHQHVLSLALSESARVALSACEFTKREVQRTVHDVSRARRRAEENRAKYQCEYIVSVAIDVAVDASQCAQDVADASEACVLNAICQRAREAATCAAENATSTVRTLNAMLDMVANLRSYVARIACVSLEAATYASTAALTAQRVVSETQHLIESTTRTAQAIARDAASRALHVATQSEHFCENYHRLLEERRATACRSASVSCRAARRASDAVMEACRAIAVLVNSRAVAVAHAAEHDANRSAHDALLCLRTVQERVRAIDRAVLVATRASMTAKSFLIRLSDTLEGMATLSSKEGGDMSLSSSRSPRHLARGVTSLSATSSDLDDEDVARMIREAMTHAEPVVSIYVHSARTGVETVNALSEMLTRRPGVLKRIELDSTSMSIDTCRAIADFSLSRLEGLGTSELCVDNQPNIKDEGIEHLCRGLRDFFVTKWSLRKLSLMSCCIGTRGALSLASALVRCRHLVWLDISHNPDIGDEGAATVVNALSERGKGENHRRQDSVSNMTHLKMCFVNAGDLTTQALAKFVSSDSSRASDLTWLDLRNNRITCDGATVVASALQARTTRSEMTILFDSNAIAKRGASIWLDLLKRRPSFSRRVHVSMDDNIFNGDRFPILVRRKKNEENASGNITARFVC